jgi:hypothetical protein
MTTPPRSPFPGMDPYLEAPALWPDVHDSLASAIRGLLNTALPAPYYARLETRLELGIVLPGSTQRRIVPDVAVLREAIARYATTEPVVTPRQVVTPGIGLRVYTEPVRHPMIEVRDPTRGHRLVTLIELVSPANKRPGSDRRTYLSKQSEVLASEANLVEIDLLRDGERLLPYLDLEAFVFEHPCDYLVLINRARGREGSGMDYTAYPISVREMLPCIPVPLADDDPDLPLDLQVAFQRAYADGPYHRAVDYTTPPQPPLGGEDVEWARAILSETTPTAMSAIS